MNRSVSFSFSTQDARRLAIALLLALTAGSAGAVTNRDEAEQAIAAARAAYAQSGAADPALAAMLDQAAGLLPSRQFTRARALALEVSRALEQSGGQGTAAASAPADNAAAQTAIEAAEAARQRAAAVKGEWRDTAKLIKEAQALAAAGDTAGATALADRARRQGELGYEQAIRERGADFPSYVRRVQLP